MTTVASTDRAVEMAQGPAKPQSETPTKPERGKRGGSAPRRADAESMAKKQRDISVSEFFAKNRHLLGFDNPRKALLTTVKEAVDNSLDACEEAGILPEITVVIEDLEEAAEARRQEGTRGDDKAGMRKSAATPEPERQEATKKGKATSGRYRVTIVDNGPGIVRKQVEHIFGRLLYGSKFHRLKMSRGQQGIGISAAGMYGLLTTGRPMVIHTKPKAGQAAHHIELAMNTKTNRAEVAVDRETDDFPPGRFGMLTPGTRALHGSGELLSEATHPTGTSVTIELEGRYQKGRGSVDEFLELTAIANPHARVVFVPPGRTMAEDDGATALLDSAKASAAEGGATAGATAAVPDPAATTQERDGIIIFPRATDALPPETREIQPHPRGVELGMLIQMLREAQAERESYTLYNFLQDKFCRVSSATASALCQAIGVTARTRVDDLDHAMSERLYRELQSAKLPPPPTDCLAPIGVQALLRGMFKGVRAEFYAASSRDADIYRGRPFQIEAAIAFGGDLPGDEPARVIRFANRVPLLFQQSACSSFKAVIETNWRNYDLQQPRDGLPVGALVVMIHMASVWVPFTSESKEAIADYDEIRKEMKLALMECGRKLGTYLRKRAKMKREAQRRDIFERYIGEVAKNCAAITGGDAGELYEALLKQAKRRTAVADQVLNDEGKVVDDPAELEGVIVVEQASGGATPPTIQAASSGNGPRPSSKKRAPASREGPRPQAGKPMSLREKAPPPGERGEPPRSSRAPAPARDAAAPAPTSRPAKPKMRLVNGKLVPATDSQPGLF
ncbi:MAG: DNA topoisomerase VI subunit B [Phycisphaerae bacterium]|nr:DNA topoisomerase VI subunit B [Phycisphaerae bacterium]